jgi:hypothetical protein
MANIGPAFSAGVRLHLAGDLPGAERAYRQGLESDPGRAEGWYIEIASRLVADPERLAQMRRELRDRVRASPLCDGLSFTRKVEAAYKALWCRCCEGLT